MTVDLTHDEIKRLIEYIEFMEQFDDDSSMRIHAETALPKLQMAAGSFAVTVSASSSDETIEDVVNRINAKLDVILDEVKGPHI